MTDGDRHRRVPGSGPSSRTSSSACCPVRTRSRRWASSRPRSPPTRRRTSPTAARGHQRHSCGSGVLDLVAKELGLDPLEIRLRNVAPRTRPAGRHDHRAPARPVSPTRESLERVAEMVGHPGLPASAGRRPGPAAGTWASAWQPSSRPRPARAMPGASAGMGKESMRLRLAEDGVLVLVYRPDAARAEPPDHPRPDRR